MPGRVEQGQLDPRWPALGPANERRGLIGQHGERLGRRQLDHVIGSERKVRRTDLGQVAGQAQAMAGQGGHDAGQQHEMKWGVAVGKVRDALQ